MLQDQLLDPVPVVLVFAVVAAVLLLAYEAGFRVGRWWQEKTPDEKEGPTGMLVGSLLALLAFLLAVTMGMAADRFDARRRAVLDEANAIGTTYLRAGYLPEPYSTDSRQLIRAYVPLRIYAGDPGRLATSLTRSAEIQGELWTKAETLARADPGSEALALYIESLNAMIDIHETRVTATIYARVPETILFALLALALISLGMVGYSAGLTRHRSAVTAGVLVIVLAGVLTLIVDLDRPGDGFLRVSQQPLLDVQRQIGPP